MNEQIANILNQPAFDRLKDWHDIGPVQKATLELFAELIVKECGVALSPMLRDMVSRGQAFDLIKQHFGVEE